MSEPYAWVPNEVNEATIFLALSSLITVPIWRTTYNKEKKKKKIFEQYNVNNNNCNGNNYHDYGQRT